MPVIKISLLEAINIQAEGHQVKTTLIVGGIPTHVKLLDVSKAYLLSSAYHAAAEAADRAQRLKQGAA